MNFTSKRFHSILIGLILAITGVAYADENGDWKKIKEDKGITVHQRKIAGWDIKQTRAHGQIATSAEEILAIIDDAKIASQINKLIAKAERLPGEDDQDVYHYGIVLDIPWPVTDRYAVYQRTITRDTESGNIIVLDEADANIEPPFKTKKLVRMVRSMQEWILKPTEDGGTDVTLTILTDPNGPIPAFLINTMTVDEPLDTLINLRKFVPAES